MPRGRKKGPGKDQKRTAHLEATRAAGIFQAALRGEIFGEHPGYADVKVSISVYNPLTKRRETLPEKELSLLMSSITEVDEMIRVFESALKVWAAGL